MKRSRKAITRKLAITALAVVLLLAAGTYIGVAVYFEDHFFYHTIIGGEDYSYKTPVEAEYLIYERLSGYSLEITGREDVHDVILPDEIDMQYIFGDSLVQIMREQKPVFWIFGFFKSYDYDLPRIAHYDEEALKQKIDGLAFFKRENIRAPRDAYITYEEEEGKYVVIDARPGTK